MSLSFGHAVDVILPFAEALPFGVYQMSNLGVIFIKPILMFPGLEADDTPAGLKDCGLQGVEFWAAHSLLRRWSVQQ